MYRRTISNPGAEESHVLTPREVNEISRKKLQRKKLKDQLAKLTDRALAKYYDVGKSTIARIK